jgi:proteic killer suppression protein
VIVGFGDDVTASLYHGVASARVRRIPRDLRERALRKLDMINAATNIQDLTVPPSNRLEQLAGKLAGFCSIRVNDQWRTIFRWSGADASEVKFTDYH